MHGQTPPLPNIQTFLASKFHHKKEATIHQVNQACVIVRPSPKVPNHGSYYIRTLVSYSDSKGFTLILNIRTQFYITNIVYTRGEYSCFASINSCSFTRTYMRKLCPHHCIYCHNHFTHENSLLPDVSDREKIRRTKIRKEEEMRNFDRSRQS